MCRARGEAEKDGERERETVEGVKLHTKGRVLKAPTIRSEDDLFSFHRGRSAGIVKFLEPLSPLLNYFEVLAESLSLVHVYPMYLSPLIPSSHPLFFNPSSNCSTSLFFIPDMHTQT